MTSAAIAAMVGDAPDRHDAGLARRASAGVAGMGGRFLKNNPM